MDKATDVTNIPAEMQEIIKLEMIPMFDYGNINLQHKSAAKEIATWLADQGHHELSELVNRRFEVVQIPKYDLSQSEFYQECQKAGVHVGIQGYTQEGTGLDAIQYPLVTASGDIRKMNELVKSIRGQQYLD